MSTELALTVLCDNHATEPLQAEHGLAFWLQGPELAALFDCGSGQTLCQNALQLQIPLASCQQVILSHVITIIPAVWPSSGAMASHRPSWHTRM
jgi:hypothetical protein